jgi:lysophospholipase L1-like esterase
MLQTAPATLRMMLIALVGVIVGVAFGYAHWRKPIASPIVSRHEVLLWRANDMAPGGVLVLGDSITDRQQIVSLCGVPVFNAAISHAKAEDILPMADALVARTRPSRLVLELGANDLLVADPTPLARYQAEMERLAGLAPRPIIVALPTDPHFLAQAQAGNAYLRRLASTTGGVFVEPLPTAMTVDGVHLNAPGRMEFKRGVNAACAK